MRKFTIILTVFIGLTISANAQIPNSGFENWTTVGSYENPNGWVNCNGNGNGIPITQSSDHYPASVGTSSVRIENYSTGSTGCSDFGFVNTALYLGYNGPSFPITGHPSSFCGYYKFLPQNNDTMTISCGLYLNGVMVAIATLTTTNTVSNWTSFTIPFSSYTTADSANAGLCAFYSFNSAPKAQGNSILYVDNLSFDNLITSVQEQTDKNTLLNIYPNPASDIVTLNIDNTNNAELTLYIYNVIGTLVKSETLKQNQRQINIGDLINGVYIVTLKSKDFTVNQRLIIQR